MPNQPPRSSPVSFIGNHFFADPFKRDATLFAWGENPMSGKLKATWSPETARELKAINNIYAEETQIKQEIQNRPMSDAITKIVEELEFVTKRLGMTGITWYERPSYGVTIGYRGNSESIAFDEVSTYELLNEAVKRTVYKLWEKELTENDVIDLARQRGLDPSKVVCRSSLSQRWITYNLKNHPFTSTQALVEFFGTMREEEIVSEMKAVIGKLKPEIKQYLNLEWWTKEGKLRFIPKLIFQKGDGPPVTADVRIFQKDDITPGRSVVDAITKAITSVIRLGNMGMYPELAQYDDFSDMVIGGDMVKPAEVGGGSPVSSPVSAPMMAYSSSVSVVPTQSDTTSITAAEFLSLPDSLQQKLLNNLSAQQRVRLVNEVQKLRQSESADMTKKIGKMGRKLGL